MRRRGGWRPEVSLGGLFAVAQLTGHDELAPAADAHTDDSPVPALMTPPVREFDVGAYDEREIRFLLRKAPAPSVNRKFLPASKREPSASSVPT